MHVADQAEPNRQNNPGRCNKTDLGQTEDVLFRSEAPITAPERDMPNGVAKLILAGLWCVKSGLGGVENREQNLLFPLVVSQADTRTNMLVLPPRGQMKEWCVMCLSKVLETVMCVACVCLGQKGALGTLLHVLLHVKKRQQEKIQQINKYTF